MSSAEIYIRPLEKEDAQTSFRWRNDSDIWKYTGSRPDREITLNIEKEWIESVLRRDDEKRFAICLKDSDEYIGNVQLTNITSKDAEFHIFIGKKQYWGKGIGSSATKLIVEYAFDNLKLGCVYLFVKKENISAIRSYEKVGFSKVTGKDKQYFRFEIYST